MDAHLGLVLRGRYKVEVGLSDELLGRVYRGRDLETETAVQIKILHAHIATDEKRFARFLREVRVTSMVRHVNTIEMLDSGSSDGVHYIVMEDFPARSLEEELQNGVMRVDRVAQIAAQIASAIGAAHQENITHRALSPRNILLLSHTRRHDFIKVRDFGLSKLEQFDTNDEASHLTEAGVRVGNTAYMAPEYIELGRYHPKGDLYALGCLMTTMLTGDPPYTGRAADILGDHVTAPIPRPSKKAEVPPWMDELVIQLLAKEPAKRPGAYQVVARLEEGAGRRLGPPSLLSDPEPEVVFEGASKAVPALLVAIVAGMLVILAGFTALTIGAVLLVLSWRTVEAPSTAQKQAPFRVETPAPTPVAPMPVAPTPVAPASTVPVAPGPTPITPTAPIPVPAVVVGEPAARTGVRVATNRRALIYLNSRPKGMAPLELDVPAGIHRIAAMLPGQPSTRQEQKIRVRDGQSYTVTFTF